MYLQEKKTKIGVNCLELDSKLIFNTVKCFPQVKFILIGDKESLIKAFKNENTNNFEIENAQNESEVFEVSLNLIKLSRIDSFLTHESLNYINLLKKEIKSISKIISPAAVKKIHNKYFSNPINSFDATDLEIYQAGQLASIYYEHIEKQKNPEIKILHPYKNQQKGFQNLFLAHERFSNSSLNAKGFINIQNLIDDPTDIVVGEEKSVTSFESALNAITQELSKNQMSFIDKIKSIFTGNDKKKKNLYSEKDMFCVILGFSTNIIFISKEPSEICLSESINSADEFKNLNVLDFIEDKFSPEPIKTE